MSKATKRKHVTNEVMNIFILPDPRQQIVKVLGGRGNNLHEVVTAQGETFLVSMPTKFRKNVWIKRGDYVIVDPIEEGDKVKAEIARILYKEQIKYIKSESLWPAEFMDDVRNDNKEAMIPDDMLPPSDDDDDDSDDSDDKDDNGDAEMVLPVNPNHRVRIITSMESTDDDDDDE